MTGPSTKKSLSAAQRRLMELMQRCNFCRIEQLTVRSGEPVFEPAPRIMREVKLGAQNGPRSELGKDNFQLQAAVIDLFDQLKALGNGVVACIEVRHGLPCRLMIEQVESEDVQ